MGDERCREAVNARDALPTPTARRREPLLLRGERRAGRAAEDEGQRGGTVTEHCSRAQRSAPGRPWSRSESSKTVGPPRAWASFPPARSALSGRVPAAPAPETAASPPGGAGPRGSGAREGAALPALLSPTLTIRVLSRRGLSFCFTFGERQ